MSVLRGLTVLLLGALMAGFVVGCGPGGSSSPSVRVASPVAWPQSPPSGPDRSPEEVACVAAVQQELTPTERVGQLLMVGISASDPTLGRGAVRTYRPGGVFLRGESSAAPARLAAQLAVLQEEAARQGPVGLHVAVDQEGGAVVTLRGSAYEVLPTATEQGAWSLPELRDRSTASAKILRAAGVTMNLAPVADTVLVEDAARNPPIGAVHRNYGFTAPATAQAVRTVVAAYGAADVIPTVKHFPGLGRVRQNTDFSSGASDPATGADDPFLDPFREAVRTEVSAVMISSARYPAIDPDQPAVFSSAVISGLLRGQLGHTGVVISDDLGAARAVTEVPIGERAVRFVAAGGDLVLTIRSADAALMGRALLDRARTSRAFDRQVDLAVTRVLTSKYRSGLIRCPGPGTVGYLR